MRSVFLPVTVCVLLALVAAVHSFQIPGFASFVPRSVQQQQQSISLNFADKANVGASDSCLYSGSDVASDERIHPARGCGFCIG